MFFFLSPLILKDNRLQITFVLQLCFVLFCHINYERNDLNYRQECTILLYSSKSFFTSWDWVSVWSCKTVKHGGVNSLNLKRDRDAQKGRRGHSEGLTCSLMWICDRRCSLVACSGTSVNNRHTVNKHLLVWPNSTDAFLLQQLHNTTTKHHITEPFDWAESTNHILSFNHLLLLWNYLP